MHADSGVLSPDRDQVDLAVEVFRMLADGTRVRMLWALGDGELSVNEIAVVIAKRPASVSQHLAKLRMAGLVCNRRQGNQILYRLENDHVRQLVVDALNHAEHVGPGVPAHHQSGIGVRAQPARTPAEASASER